MSTLASRPPAVGVMAANRTMQEMNNRIKFSANPACAVGGSEQPDGGRAFRVCGRCKEARYCQKDCQKDDVRLAKLDRFPLSCPRSGCTDVSRLPSFYRVSGLGTKPQSVSETASFAMPKKPDCETPIFEQILSAVQREGCKRRGSRVAQWRAPCAVHHSPGQTSGQLRCTLRRLPRGSGHCRVGHFPLQQSTFTMAPLYTYVNLGL